MNIDIDGINEVITDLSRAGLRAGIRVAEVLDDSGRRIVETGKRLAPSTRLPHYAGTITHELTREGASLGVEAGPERKGQGKLGHILEKGSSKSPPHAHMGPALDLEAPRAVRDLADAVDPFD